MAFVPMMSVYKLLTTAVKNIDAWFALNTYFTKMCNTGVKQQCQYAELLCEINFTTEIFVQLLFFCASVSSSLIGITSSCWPQTPGNRSYYDNPRNETPPIYIELCPRGSQHPLKHTPGSQATTSSSQHMQAHTCTLTRKHILCNLT